MDITEDLDNIVSLGYLIVIGIAAYFGWKFYDSFTNPKADNGQNKCAGAYPDVNCTSGNGGPCGVWEFYTATTCFEGTSPPTPETSSPDSSSSLLGLGSLFTGSNSTPSAPSPPGAPAGCNYITGDGC